MNTSAEIRTLGPRDPLGDARVKKDLARDYMIWDSHVGGARRVEACPLVLSRASHEAAARAAEDVVRAIGVVASRAHADPLESARYGFSNPVVALAAASHDAGDDASLVRVDLLLGDDGAWRACEINADCPGGHNETVALPQIARDAGFIGVNPTDVVTRLVDRIVDLADGGAVGLLHASAYAEDLQVCAFLQRQLHARDVAAYLVSPTAPRLDGGELVARGRPIHALYRYFPAEYMEGQENVADVITAIRTGAARSITSFAHMYSQSKLAFARAWALEPSLDEASRSAIARHVPETRDVVDVPRERLLAERADWVVKRSLGRVGDQVHVGTLMDEATWTQCVDEALKMRARGESWIAQRFVTQNAVASPWGDRFVTLGAYVLDGKFAGYFARVTPQSHVSHDALCVPVFVEAS
jgi:glutathionylspermidine synthase